MSPERRSFSPIDYIVIPQRPGFALDLEGTLVNLEPLHQISWQEVAERFGVLFGAEQHLQFAGAGDKAISEEIARLLSSHAVSAEQIREAKAKVYKDMLYTHEVAPREGVPEYLERARQYAGDLIIASLTPRENAEYILNRSHLRPFFTYVLTADSVKRLKPDPEVYLRAGALLGGKKLLIHEDSPPGVAAGKATGNPVAAFPVLEGLVFDPQPDVIFLSWVGLEPQVITEKLIEK